MWKNGNSLIFRNKSIDTNVVGLIFSQTKDVDSILLRSTTIRQRCPIEVKWMLRKFGWVKLNMDGSSIRNLGSDSCVGVIHNHMGG